MDKEKIILSLLFLSTQITEKLLRLESYYKLANEKIILFNSDLLNNFKKNISTLIKNDLINIFHQIKKLEQYYSPNTEQATYSSIMFLCRKIDSLFLQLSYIQYTKTPLELKYFIDSLFNGIFEKYHKNQFNIIFSDIYSFEKHKPEIGNADNLKKGESQKDRASTVLLLPKIENTNPLHWGNLVHEMAHAMPNNIVDNFRNHKNQIKKNKKKEYSGENEKILMNWIDEIRCDLTAFKVLGLAYFSSFIDIVTNLASHINLDKNGDNHPCPTLRINLMNRYIKNEKKYTFVKNLFDVESWSSLSAFYRSYYYQILKINVAYEKLESDIVDFEHQNNVDIEPLDLIKFIEKNYEEITSPLEVNTPIKLSLDLLRSKLEDGIPIGTNSTIEGVGINLLKNELKLLEKVINEGVNNDNEIVNKKNKIFNKFKEEATCISDILNSGWLYKCENIYQHFIKEIRKCNADKLDESFEKIISDFKYKLFYLDDLLRNSIETSYLSELFSKELNIDN